jgi:transposase-like protein
MSGVKNFNDAEKQKLMQVISQGSQVLGEIDDLRGGLKDTVKAVAEELGVKSTVLTKAISIAHKGNYGETNQDFELVESILVATGKIK